MDVIAEYLGLFLDEISGHIPITLARCMNIVDSFR